MNRIFVSKPLPLCPDGLRCYSSPESMCFTGQAMELFLIQSSTFSQRAFMIEIQFARKHEMDYSYSNNWLQLLMAISSPFIPLCPSARQTTYEAAFSEEL